MQSFAIAWLFCQNIWRKEIFLRSCRCKLKNISGTYMKNRKGKIAKWVIKWLHNWLGHLEKMYCWIFMERLFWSKSSFLKISVNLFLWSWLWRWKKRGFCLMKYFSEKEKFWTEFFFSQKVMFNWKFQHTIITIRIISILFRRD